MSNPEPLPVEPLPVEPLPVEPISDDPAADGAAAPEAILDYASPRSRGKMRLPTNSRIVCEPEGAGIRIVETLVGRGNAILAMLFAIFILVEWAAIGLSEMRYGRGVGDWLPGVLAMGIPWLGYLGLLLMVVHQTWRKTILRVDRERVMLQFNSPLRRKSYRWEAGEVVLVQAMITYTAPNAWPLGEVRLHLSDRQRVHLFTDHRLSDIDRLVAAIQMAFLGSARLSDLPTALV